MADPAGTARSFATELERVLGERLRSVLLYGSVARGEAVPGVSDINVLVLLDEIRLDDLRRGSGLARRWVEAGNTAPLLLDDREWRRSADAFAVELSDMKERHELLLGTDPLEGLVVEPRALRLQAERELRGKVLQLQEGMLVAGERGGELTTLLLAALPSFTTYLRALLRLEGRRVPEGTERVIEEGCRLAGAEAEGLLGAWSARAARRPPAWTLESPEVGQYWRAVKRITSYVDELSAEEGR